MSPYRKPNHRHGGMEVRVCGRTIQKERNIVCTLFPRHPPTFHSAVVADDNGDVYAVVETPDGDVQVWRIAEAHE